MIDAQKIKTRRKNLHVSQKALAAGITTQSTISKLENEGVAPRPDLLAKIAGRLNLKMSDLIIGASKSVEAQVDDADSALRNQQLELASKYLQRISINDLYAGHPQLHYLFLKSAINFLLTNDSDQGIFDFNRLLDRADKLGFSNSIYTSLAHSELATIYFAKNNPEAAKYYLQLIPQSFDLINISSNLYWILFLKHNVAKTWFDLHQYSLSLSCAQQALHLAQKHNTLILVDSLTFLISLNLSHLDNGWKNIEAKKYLLQAWALANYTNNLKIQTKVTEILSKTNTGTEFSIQDLVTGAL